MENKFQELKIIYTAEKAVFCFKKSRQRNVGATEIEIIK